MRIEDARLREIDEVGYTLIEDFLEADVLKAAQDALWDIYPHPEDYFANPGKYEEYSGSHSVEFPGH